MKCPHCQHNPIQKSEGKYKIRVPILVFSDDGGCVTSCPKCHKEMPVPVALLKAEIQEQAEQPKLVLARGLTRSEKLN